jgi:hypothetical protein
MGMQDFAKHQVLPVNGLPSKAQAYLSNAYHHQQMLQITPYNAAGSSSLQPGGKSNNFDNIK